MRKRRSRRGFSLVVSLVMMALMLLIAITLISFVYVQTKLTESRLKRAQAQINAICGMRIALGQLQLLTGDDQRVTATGDIFGGSGNNSLPSGKALNGKRFWTGVWATGGLDKSKIRDWSVYSPDKKPFLGWLVSNYDSAKEVYSPYENPVGKETASKSSETLLKNVQDAFTYDDEKLDIISIVGQGSLGADKDAADELNYNEREVKVRRVPLQKYSAASTEAIRPLNGSFAYWVGDEGVKAKINIPDGTDEKFVKNKDWDQLFNVAAQRNGVSLVEGLSNFDSWWDKDAENASVPAGTRLRYVGNASSLPVYVEALGGGSVSTLKESAQKLFHDVSFVSQGILTDTYNGGLKTDLSLAFEMPWEKEGQWTKGFRDIKKFHGSGEKNNMNLLSKFKVDSRESWWTTQPDDGLGYLYEIATGESSRDRRSGDEVKYLRGPTWDLVRNYYRLYKREDEKNGFRGLKPQHSDSWIAVGSRPYTFVSGISNQINSSDGSNGWLGEKYNYSSIVCRHTGSYWGRWSALLTEFNGQSHSRPSGTSSGDVFSGQYTLPAPQSMRISPVVRRIVIRASIIFNKSIAAICFDPIITIHNPYNVPIEFFGFGALWTKFFPFQFKLVREDIDETTGSVRNWPGTSSSVLSFSGADLFGSNGWDWRLFSRLFAGTTSRTQAPSGTIRMLPGEVKVMFPASSGISTDINSMGITKTVGSICGFQFEEMSNMTRKLSAINLTKLAEETSTGDGTGLQFHVEIEPIPDNVGATSSYYNDLDILAFHLYYPESCNGANLRTTTGMIRSWGNQNTTSFGDVVDNSDYDLAQVIAFRRYFPKDKVALDSKSLTQTPESGVDAPEKQYVVYIDVQNCGLLDTEFSKDFAALAAPFVSNARPWVVTPVAWDGDIEERNVGIGWKKKLLSDPETNPVANTNERGYWGDNSDATGETNIVLFEIPTAPLVSLGQLQHVDCSVLDMEPSYVIGNSYSNLGFKTSELDQVLVWPATGYMGNGNARYASAQSPQPRGDTPFAANLELFDSYFFSGINVGDADSAQNKDIGTFVTKVFSTDETENPFPNKRISLIRDFGDRKESDVKKDFYDPEKVARDLMFDGTFNVNSTSKEAWKAVLSGLQGKILKIDGTWKEVSSTPLARFVSIIGKKLGGFGTASDSKGDDGNGWRWYCELSDSELDKLAEAIVEQVRSRGPFMSLGDFVNRRLTTGTNGKAGALQAAIDASGINKSRASKFNDKNPSNSDSSRYPNLSPTGANLTKAGVPGYVSQGDILSATAPSLSARSDTFTIRAYGDVFGVSGTPQARAWCEAVVQRTPEFFDPQYDDETEEEVLDVVKFRENYRSNQDDEVSGRGNKYVLEKRERNDKLSSVNKLFGRRYKIVSFRWLSQDEL